MGVSRSPQELAFKINTAAKQFQYANEDGVKKAAQAYKRSVLNEARRDVGADLRMRRWGRRGVKLGAGYSFNKNPQPRAVLTPRPAGVWSALSNGTRPHEIRTRRRKGAKALRVGDGFAASVQHPGAKGKRTWQRGIAAARPTAMQAFRQEHRKKLAKVFR
jgi:hypothetical protein